MPKRKFFEPPSGLNPASTAIASISVDFPDPFSPMRNVTLASRSSSSSDWIEGIANALSHQANGPQISGRRLHRRRVSIPVSLSMRFYSSKIGAAYPSVLTVEPRVAVGIDDE